MCVSVCDGMSVRRNGERERERVCCEKCVRENGRNAERMRERV